MSSTSPNPAGPEPLPTSIRRTRGPTGDDSSCAICHEQVEPGDPTLTHDDCGRWFGEECLLKWIKSQSAATCPWCRADLWDLWDLDQHERFHRVVEALEDLPGRPQMYHVRRTGAQVVELFQPAVGDMLREELEKLVSDAIELAVDAIDFASTDIFELHEYPFGYLNCAHCILARHELEALDTTSLRHLWTAHRVLGYHRWFLLRLAAAPTIGVWLPRSTGDHIHACRDIGVLHCITPDELHDHLLKGSSELLSVPLSTDFLCDAAMPINEVRGNRGEAIQTRDVAVTHGITHWCLVDISIGHRNWIPDGNRLLAIPWPKETRLRDGYRTQNYFGETATKTKEIGGWKPEVEAPLLKRFVSQHALMSEGEFQRYLLGSKASDNVVEVYRRRLRYGYGIVSEEDLRLTEDEKWSTGAGLRLDGEIADGSLNECSDHADGALSSDEEGEESDDDSFVTAADDYDEESSQESDYDNDGSSSESDVVSNGWEEQ